jgi:hypothetical protein
MERIGRVWHDAAVDFGGDPPERRLVVEALLAR